MGCNQAKLKTMPSETVLEVVPWKLIYTSSLENWTNVEASRWDFDYMLDLSCKKTRLQPWCMAGRNFEVLLPAPLDEHELDVKYLYDQMLISDKRQWKNYRIKLHSSYKHKLPNKIKACPFLESAQVVGFHTNRAIVQVVRNDNICDFLMVDLVTKEVMGKYSEPYQDQPFLCECTISPDLSRFLIKPNLLFVLKFRVEGIDDCVKVVTKDPNSDEYLVTSQLFKDSALDLIMTFDPRYKHTRVAIGNMTKRGQHVLCIYNLKSRKIMQKTYGPQYQKTQNLLFSPDGEYLAALIVTYILGPNMYPERYNFLGVMVYSTNKITLLHKIQSFGTPSVPTLTPAAVFPCFSRLGDFLAMGSGSGSAITRVEVYKMPPSINLQNLCRVKINQNLSTEEIDNLPILDKYKDFILYRPMEDVELKAIVRN